MPLTDRQREALDHERSICVTAGAGTGKTKVLVEKYIDLLGSEALNVGVENILALTFTEKAAKEMKERVRAALQEKEGGRWEQIREDFLWANISTFHSFCAQVLREFPLEAGVDPGFAVLEDREARRIREEAVEALFHTHQEGEVREALLHALRSVGPLTLRDHLLALYESRQAAIPFFADLKEDESLVVSRWEDLFRSRREAAVGAFFSDPPAVQALDTLRDLASRYPGREDGGMAYLRSIEEYLPALHASHTPEVVARALLGMAGVKGAKNMGSARFWQNGDLERLRESFVHLRDTLQDLSPSLSLAFDADTPFSRATLRYLRGLGTLFTAFSDSVDSAKARMGALDFSDMIFLAHRLFHEKEDTVARSFRERFRYVLVDEFQDTDPVQCQILWKIVGDLSAKSERIFIVGDPKQSIYLFRAADVTEFKRAKVTILGNLEGREVSLDINFRSTPEVLGCINHLFSLLLQDSGRPWEFGYEPLKESDGRKNDTGSVELLLIPRSGDTAKDAMAEAEMVARTVQHIVEREKKPVYWSASGEHLDTPAAADYRDIAILLERRSNLRYYEWALRRYGIPYHIHAGIGFYGRQEILDLYNLLRFLDNPLDSVALYGALRSPYFGLSDSDLYRVHERGGSGPLWQRLERYGESDPGLRPAILLLAGWLDYSHREPPDRLIGRILSGSGIYAVYGGMAEGEWMVANVEKLVAMARDAGGSVTASLGDFIEGLRLNIADEQREGEAQLDLATGNTVNIMTVHAAKGLEFPIVVVPDMAAGMPPETSSILVDEQYGIGISIPDPEKEYELEEMPVLKALREERMEKLRAERKRLFYVAATRAKDHLVVCGTSSGKIPACLADCRNRIDWLLCCLDVTDEAILRRKVEFTPPGWSTSMTVPIATRPDEIPAEVREMLPRRIEVSPALQSPPSLPPSLLPAALRGESPAFSVSGISAYLRCPREYRKTRLPGRQQRDPAASPYEENARTTGLLIHEIFHGRDAGAAAEKYGIRDPGRIAAYRDLYRAFMGSPLLENAREDYCEVPFTTTFASVPFTGVIDRLVRTADGSWVLVDYKTGRVEKASLPGKLEEYSLQMAVYSHAAEQILKQAARAFIYFTDLREFVEMPAHRDKALRDVCFALENISAGRFSFPECDGCPLSHGRTPDAGGCPGLRR